MADKRGYNKAEAAAYVGLTQWSLDEEVRKNRLAARKRGTTVIFLVEELDRWLNDLPERV